MATKIICLIVLYFSGILGFSCMTNALTGKSNVESPVVTCIVWLLILVLIASVIVYFFADYLYLVSIGYGVAILQIFGEYCLSKKDRM